MPRLRSLIVAVLAGALAAPAASQPTASDPDVQKGISQVEDGEYDAAILLLDNAARRLAADPARGRELATAYLYLGIAYLGKGAEAAARSNFREAVTRLRDLSLSPEKFSPRVIDLVEAAKAEVGKGPTVVAASPAPRTSPAPAASPRPQGGGGGKKVLLIGGAVVAAGAGTALALGGGGDDGECDTVYEEREGQLRLPGDRATELRAGPASDSGSWYAELSWRDLAPARATSPSARTLPTDVILIVHEGSPNGPIVLQGGLISSAMRKAEWNGPAGAVYFARAALQDGGASSVSYTLAIGGPCE
jgi:hypothetical protein